MSWSSINIRSPTGWHPILWSDGGTAHWKSVMKKWFIVHSGRKAKPAEEAGEQVPIVGNEQFFIQ